MEEPTNTVDEENSEAEDIPSDAEDLLLSDDEDANAASLGEHEDAILRIDYNARIVNRDVKCENDGDDCSMYFPDRNSFLGRRGSESGLHTSTEDLNFSDDEKSDRALTFQSVNLDGMASTSAKTNPTSLSTLNYSHTVFKNEYLVDTECTSEEIRNNMKGRKDKKTLPPGLTVAGLSSGIKMASSVILPTTQKALNTLNIKNAFSNSLILDEDVNDIQDEQESPPMTCLEFLKSELSDGNNTDAEDMSVGSLDGIGDTSRKGRKESNTIDISGNDKRFLYPGDRRASTGHTEDEIFSMENLPGRSQKRVKKRNFRISDKKDVSDGSGTDEELL